MLNTATADSLIRCWRAKFDDGYWRPVTAIREGAIDPDPTWTPLAQTPPYPEYASGHACATGAMTGTVRYLFGSRGLDLVVSSSVTGTTRHYDSLATLQQDTRNARIWLGFHFRRAMIDGTAIGTYTAGHVRDHYFQRTH